MPPGASPSTGPGGEAGRATSRLVVAGRLLLLAASCLAVVSAFTSSRWRERAPNPSLVLLVCPMHPEVTSRTPGDCPICHMALEPSPHAAASAVHNGARHGSIEKARTRLLADRVRAPAWVEDDGTVGALLYKDDLLRLAPDERGRFFRASAPAAGLPVRVAARSTTPWDGSTCVTRFRLDGGTGARTTATTARPSPGEAGWIDLDPKPHELLTVPWSAVLYSAEGPYVLVAAGEDGFRRQPVEIGRALYERVQEGRLAPNAIVVLSGLRTDEPVVVGEAFVSDVERRLSTAREPARGLDP